MEKPLKRFDAPFKRDALELLLTSGKPLKVLAVELGLCDVTLRGWRDRHLAKTQSIETDGKKLSAQQPPWNSCFSCRSNVADFFRRYLIISPCNSANLG